MISYGKHFVDKSDIKAVSKVLKSPFLTSGPTIKKFEDNIKKYVKSNYFLSCSSGTAALDLVFRSLELKVNDNIIIPSINFIAAYNLLKEKKVNIFLADVDPDYGQITEKTMLECIKINKIKKIRALLVMYHGGYTGFKEQYIKLKKKYNFLLIEDACHAFGGEYKIKNIKGKIGDSRFADFSTFSFHPVKSLTTAEGGGISIKNKKYFNKIKLLRSHGIKRSNKHWRYDVLFSGLNYRMSDVNAALGISQLKKIKLFLNYRRKISNIYLQSFKKYSHIVEVFPKNFNNSSCHLLFLKVKNKKKNFKENFLMYLKKKIYWLSTIIFLFINFLLLKIKIKLKRLVVKIFSIK